MPDKESIDVLYDLVQLDIDAIHAYKQALKEIDDIEIHANINGFMMDHERHVRALEKIIVELGETPPEIKQDFKGYMIEGFTAIQSKLGQKMALKAMQTNEKLTNKKYSDALSHHFPDHIRSVISQNYEDEQRHLTYINDVLQRG